MKAALYARVSTADGLQDIANQITQLRQFAYQQGWRIVQEYVDHESGSKSDRRQFLNLFADAQDHKFDVVLFWALDRLTRKGALETLQYLNRLSSYGVGFRSFTESYLDSCGVFKDAVVAILAAIAKQERLRISERVKSALNRAKAKGTRSGQPVGRPRAVFRRDQALELRRNGFSWREISSKLHVGVSTLKRECRRSNEPGQTPPEAPKPPNGEKSKLTRPEKSR